MLKRLHLQIDFDLRAVFGFQRMRLGCFSEQIAVDIEILKGKNFWAS